MKYISQITDDYPYLVAVNNYLQAGLSEEVTKFKVQDENSSRAEWLSLYEVRELKPLGYVKVKTGCVYYGVVSKADLKLMSLIEDTEILKDNMRYNPEVVYDYSPIENGFGYFLVYLNRSIGRGNNTVLGHLDKMIEYQKGFMLYFEDRTLVKYRCDVEAVRKLYTKWRVMNNGIHK